MGGPELSFVGRLFDGPANVAIIWRDLACLGCGAGGIRKRRRRRGMSARCCEPGATGTRAPLIGWRRLSMTNCGGSPDTICAGKEPATVYKPPPLSTKLTCG